MPDDDSLEASIMDHQRKFRRQKGFTVIELLVVLGIIAILSAIAFTAFRAMQKSAAEKKTRTMLANAASLLAEYGAGNSLRDQPAYMWDRTGAKYTAAGFDIWSDADPTTVPKPTATPATGMDPLLAPPDPMEDDLATVVKSQAVLNTATVMRELKRTPSFEKMMAQLPANSTMMVYEPNTNPPVLIGPVLLDGWGHPIIFVPSTGLDRAYIGDFSDPRNPFRVTSVKVYPAAGVGSLNAAQAIAPIPGARPFFASAGPDGLFSFADTNASGGPDAGDQGAGDDNLYSFEK
jgi:prepilin-type N-terminal cleavage/methylation domain-containing protein